jgi:hypothetical protein
MRSIYFRMLIVVLVAVAACEHPTDPASLPGNGVVVEGDLVRGTGVVLFFDVEGGFYAIRGDNKVTYGPTSLPAEFQRDGLRVRFVARLRGDLVGVGPGPIVDIVDITRS